MNKRAITSAERWMSPRLFKALGEANRISLVMQLAGCGGATVGQAARCCPVDMSVVSRHLAVLREAGIVEHEKRGKEVHYRLRADALVATLRAIADAIESCCATNNCCGPTPQRARKGARP
ncbi:MAG: ArsR/SmtB family transcription factor [Dongiaceae bacterium]